MAFDDTSSTANAVPLPPLGKAHIDHLVEQSFRRGEAVTEGACATLSFVDEKIEYAE